MYTLSLPLVVPVSKKRDWSLNMNQYRNAHYQVTNKAKTVFCKTVQKLLAEVPVMDKCELKYIFYPGTAQRHDLMNVVSIVDKFFSDTLTEAGRLADDDCLHLGKVTSEYGGIDRANPRVDVIITPIGETTAPIQEEEDMQVTLVQAEVEEAIREYLNKRITVGPNTDINIEITNGRGPEGLRAQIDLVPMAEKEEETQDPQPETTKPRASTKKQQTAPTKETEVKAEEAKAEEEAAPFKEEEPTENGDTATGAEKKAGDAESTDEDEAGKKPTSLFAGLKRPKND